MKNPGTRPLPFVEDLDRSMMGGPEPAASCVLIASTPRRGSPVQRILDMMENEPREMLAPPQGWIAGVDFNRTPHSMSILRVDLANPMDSFKRALDFGALEYFEDGVHIIEDGPTEAELAAIESIVSDRSSRCITGSAATSCGVPS